MPSIFLSYRRTDSTGTAGRLFDRLSEHFGRDEVFRDIDSIEVGENFDRRIRDALDSAAAVLVVIGPRWFEAQPDGSRRINDPRDYVRLEIELALASNALVVPVLVDGTRMPPATLLPASLREFTTRQAAELSDRHWGADVQDLLARLDARIGTPTTDSTDGAYGRVALAALSGFVPNMFSLIRRPRQFLQRTQGPGADLLAALVFFVSAVLLGILILLSAYTPRRLANFALVAPVVGLFGTLVLSAPLWVGWRVAGATRHYSRLLVMLLYQMAIVHLAVYVAMWVVLAAIDWRSHDAVGNAMEHAMRFDSGPVMIKSTVDELAPIVGAPAVRLGLLVATVVLVATAMWIARSWKAYRTAFALGRARSLIALVIAVFVAWAGLRILTVVRTL